MSDLKPTDIHPSHDVREQDSTGIASDPCCVRCGASALDNAAALTVSCQSQTIPRQPLATAPEGVKVQLVFRDKEGNMWRSPRPFVLNNGKWRSETTGLLLSGIDPIGWNRWTETQKDTP